MSDKDSKIIGINPTAEKPFVPGILFTPPTKAKADALGLPIDVPVQVGQPAANLGFAIAAAQLLESGKPGAVPVVYMNDTSKFQSPNGLQPRRTNHVDDNGKPLYMYIVS